MTCTAPRPVARSSKARDSIALMVFEVLHSTGPLTTRKEEGGICRVAEITSSSRRSINSLPKKERNPIRTCLSTAWCFLFEALFKSERAQNFHRLKRMEAFSLYSSRIFFTTKRYIEYGIIYWSTLINDTLQGDREEYFPAFKIAKTHSDLAFPKYRSNIECKKLEN